MSAEKEVVNFWLNRKGYFTVSNIKSGNKDVGILALKLDKDSLTRIMHIEISCSISGFNEQADFLDSIIKEKFNDANVDAAIKKYIDNAGKGAEIEKLIVVNSLPNKKEAIEKLGKNSINAIEFESILSEVMKELKTEYFRNDSIRALQIAKFLLMSNPKKMVDVMCTTLSPAKRREFLAEMLSKDDVIKEFRKTNEERLALILKEAMIKPERLAEMLERDVLNRKTRKPFIDSLMQQEKIGKAYKKELKAKEETPLAKFFG